MTDKRIRKSWLIFLIVNVPVLIITYFCILGALVYLWKNGIISDEAILKNTVTQMVSTGLESFLGSIILFFCAYRKPGTKLLTLTLIFGPLVQLFNITRLILMGVLILKFMPVTAFKQTVSIFSAFILFELVWSGCWYYLCFKLRQMNKKLKNQEKKEREDGLAAHANEAMANIDLCWQLDQLQATYSEEVKKYPACESLITEAFKKRRALLKELSKQDAEANK